MKRARLPLVLLALLALIPPAMSEEGDTPTSTNPQVKMETTLGDMVIELDVERAPISVYNFLQYAADGYYDGTIFHRVMPTFMIQGGGFTPALDKKTDGLRAPIYNEWKNGLKNVRGTISMARTNQAHSATSQFFINVVDNAALDRPRGGGAAYAVFGKVVEGMETVDTIRYTETKTDSKYGGGQNKVVPVEPVVINAVQLLGDYALEDAAAAAEVAKERMKAEEEAALAEKKAAADAQRAKEKPLVDELVKKLESEAGAKFTTTASGLMYLETATGEGENPQPTDTVEVHYRGTLLDGTEFDSSYKRGETISFPLNRVIKGWTEGVGMMKPGGKCTLIIPSDLAYGERGSPPVIGPNSTLVFEIELVSIK